MMSKSLMQRHVVWMLTACGLLVTYYMGSMWTLSVDLAHHYALAYRLTEQGLLAKLNDPSLGEMNIYPRGSHILAAIIGVLVNSTFLGIQIAALASLSLLWMGILLILSSMQFRLAMTALMTFTLIFALNAVFIRLDGHGHEIVGNFFYSQFAGQAIIFLGIAGAIYLEKAKGRILPTLLLSVLMFISMSVHLLPALEILGLIHGLLIVYVWMGGDAGGAFRSRLLAATGISIASITGFLVHPSFAAMRVIAGNDGDLDLRFMPYPLGLIIPSVLVLALSGALIFKWVRAQHREENVAFKYIAFLGATTASLCLLQYALTTFGYGSIYAVKKYGFGLVTLLFLEVSILAAMSLANYLDARKPIFITKLHKFSGHILVGCLCVLFVLSVPRKKMIDVFDIVKLEKSIANASQTIIPVPERKKYNVVIGLDGMPSVINYMFSVAQLKTFKNLAVQDILRLENLSDLAKYSHVLSSQTNPLFRASGCDVLAAGELSIVKSQCLAQRFAKLSECGTSFQFSRQGAIPNSLLKGFAGPEEAGRWTNGKVVEFSCLNEGAPKKRAKLYLSPFLYGELKGQSLIVEVNGKPQGEYKITRSHDDEPLVIDLATAGEVKAYNLVFKMPDARSPREVGQSFDRRVLGLRFKSIVFE